jgi:16S rRNA (guanine966-N2)-methyltransferase
MFVDASADAIGIVKKNIEKTRFSENTKTQIADYRNFLRKSVGREGFDIIFLDPPYKLDVGEKALKLIAENRLLNENGVVVYECDKPLAAQVDGWEKTDERRYGKAYFTFFKAVQKD